MDDAARARQLHLGGRLVEAVEWYARAALQQPDHVQLKHDYAVALMQLGRESDAAVLFESVLSDSPARADSAMALALCLRAIGDLLPAREAAAQAANLAPDDPHAWLVLGSLQVGIGAVRDGEQSLRRCLQLAPAFAEASHYLGEALQLQERWVEAAHAYRNAMQAQPTEVMNVAICAERAGDLVAARAGYIQMCQLRPGRSDSLLRLAQVCSLLCEFEQEAQVLGLLEATLRLEEREPDDVPEVFPISYLQLSQFARMTILDRYVARVQQQANGLADSSDVHARPAGRIRIGYLSADFCEHAVGTLLDGFFAAHDRAAFLVFGYSLRASRSRLGVSLRGEFDVHHECGDIADDAVARLVADDRIDVLFDLTGFTAGSRPGILARRPAPVQIGWLGFIHGQQAPWLDGILMDEHVQPEHADWAYDDRLLRMPGFMLPSGRAPKGQPRRSDFGIPEGVPVFASFNNAYKLDVELVAAWAEITSRATDLHLLIYLNPAARAGFVRKWSELDGDPRRLMLVDEVSRQDQADRAASCDLMLDAFRYQAGATALGCASAGLPVLSRMGATALGRLSVSMNRFLGMEDLICDTTEEYIQTAVRLANCTDALELVRREFRANVVRTGLLAPRRAAAAVESVVKTLLGEGAG